MLWKIARLSILAGCLWIGAARAAPEDFRDFVIWHLPPGDAPVPVVLMLEGSGGTRASSRSHWASFFNERGVAVAQIRSAAVRGKSNWFSDGCGLLYRTDAGEVLELARREQPRIDASRYAILGLSRGGTEALNTRRSFEKAANPPAAVFSFYPGCTGYCPTDFAADGPTEVHIFYGEADEWGQFQGSYARCRSLAKGSIRFHGFPGAHHGFDSAATGSFGASGRSFRYEPHPEANEKARAIIDEVLARVWPSGR